MDKKKGSSTNFMPDDLLKVICILEREKNHNLYKIIGKRNYFSLITKFPTKNGEWTPLKNCASARSTDGSQSTVLLGQSVRIREPQLLGSYIW